MLDHTSRVISFRSAQLSALENVLLGRQLSADIKPTGRPVREGYISSYFGQRMDPFDGEEAFHKGLDFATEAGADVLAVASGVVTWAGPREGYGNLVEINHGNGYMTRYAHNERTLVNVGDQVERGQAIADGRLDRPLDRSARALRGRQGRRADRPDVVRRALS